MGNSSKGSMRHPRIGNKRGKLTMSQILTVTFDGEAFYPETQLNLEPNKRYQIQIYDEENRYLRRQMR